MEEVKNTNEQEQVEDNVVDNFSGTLVSVRDEQYDVSPAKPSIFRKIKCFFRYYVFRKLFDKLVDRKNIKIKFKKLDKEYELRVEKFPDDWYGNECVKDAVACYKALFKVMYKQSHSGYSHGCTVTFMKRLLDEKPLTSITDDDFVEDEYQIQDADYTEYTCTRYSGLYKKVYNDGRVTYNDVSRIVFMNGITQVHFSSGVEKYLVSSGLIPEIKMPYWVAAESYEVNILEARCEDVEKQLNYKDYRYIDFIKTPDDEIIKVDRLIECKYNGNDKSTYTLIEGDDKTKIVELLKSQKEIYDEEYKDK